MSETLRVAGIEKVVPVLDRVKGISAPQKQPSPMCSRYSTTDFHKYPDALAPSYICPNRECAGDDNIKTFNYP